MRVTLLGTGSADGWPNPFCACRSCATERRAGRARRPSAALVDDVILLDCGPTTPHLPSGFDLTQVEHVLITHGHPDHLHPAFLLTRSWVEQARPMQVWGPESAIDLCRDWCAPDNADRLHVVRAGDKITLPTAQGDVQVRVVAARHDHGNGDIHAADALLYSLTSLDGRTLLYATDTGPFDPASLAIPAIPHDVVLIDATFGDTLDHGTGHLDLATLPAQIDRLRAHGSISDATRVLATHLSHHNPPAEELRPRLAAIGIELPEDFVTIDTTGDTPRHTLLLGGARSGKSHHAESLLAGHSGVTYVATGGPRPDDPEWHLRVAAHRARRPITWTTVESTDVVATLSGADGPCLIDCLALWLTAQLDDMDAWQRWESGERDAVLQESRMRIDLLCAAIAQHPWDVVVVSNEVGMGVVPSTSAGRLFRDLLGIANIAMADACDRTLLVVAGRTLDLTEEP
jgi:adenosylcobinamide kinase / adenosylcobinamide-phosphate guanylyltransferase